jgi:uncharacterized protein
LEVTAKLDKLREILQSYGRTLVCFSGGVDSTFLLRVAADTLGDGCHAVTCVSETMAQGEIEDARALGRELGLGDRHHVVDSHELERPGFADNPVDRCAMCKTELMEHAAPLAATLGIEHIALGTNVDDLGDYRPGIQAARDRGAVAPMVDAGLTKADIRTLSQQLGLRTWDKPQLACLSSRFPYGTKITPERLRRVDAFEDGLRALGFSTLRVRFHDTIARVELSRDEMIGAFDKRDEIVALGNELGFTYVALDLAGFRSGSLNESGLVSLRRSGDKAS